MLIKYYFQVGHQFQHDPMSGMVIPDVDQFQFFKNGILSLLKKDKVNVDRIESLKYWSKLHEGWVEISDKTVLDFRQEEEKELKLLIKLNDDFPSVSSDLQLHFNTMLSRVKSLENKLKELDTRLKNSSGILHQQHSTTLLNTPSLDNIQELTRNISMQPLSLSSEDSRLDIAFLYSNPLVKEEDRRKLTPMNDPIDFESEINCLVDIFQNSEKKITARFEVANLDNISEIIRKKPKILHISSHGSYGLNKEGENEFYLNFEDHQGKLDRFNAERLSNLLKSSSDDKSQIEVVFVSACHSEAVAKVFREAKVPAVICVHSANEVLDEAAQKFSKIFYECLLDGKDLKYSFEQARRVVSSGIDKTVNTCCCTHIHKPECRWQEKATKDGEEAHQMHLKRCNCNNKESHMHVNNCSWALNLQGSFGFESIVEGNFIKICCCSPEVAHNESNKFILKVDNNFENESIFSNLPSGNLEIKNKNCCLNINFTVEMKTSLIGRNIELHNVISILSVKNANHKRLVTVHGDDGVGKNSFVKLAGKYMFERKFFQDGVIYLNTRGHIFTETWFISKIIANLDLDNVIDDILHFCNLIKQLRILIIVNFSKQQEDSAREIRKTLKTILDHTRTPKLLVTMDKPLNIEPYENKTKLEPLSDFYSAKLLMTLANNYLPKVIKNDVVKIAKHEYIQISQGIPSKIYYIAGLLQEHKTFEALVEKIKKEDLKRQALSDQLVEILLDNMSKNSVLIYEILFLFSIIPNGILEEEIVEIYKKNNVYIEIFDVIKLISCNTIVIIKSINKEIGTSYSLAYDLVHSITSLNIEHEIKLKCYKELVRYYAKLMRNLVLNLYDNQESPTEFSAAQNFGMWLTLNKTICTVPSAFQRIKSPIKRYFFNETNILSMLKVDNPYLKELIESGNEEFIESIEQLSICMPTILKLGKKMTECVTVYNFFLKICEEYQLSLAQARLYLFKASLHSLFSNNQNNYHSFNYYRSNINNIYSDCNKTGSINIFGNLIEAKKLFEIKNFEEGDAETSFVKGVILYEIESSKCRYSFERIAKEVFEEIMKELDRSIKIYRRIQNSSGLARVCYIMSQYNINNRQYEEIALKNFKEALTIFEKNNNKIMQIKCLQGIGLWYFGIENLVMSKDYLEQAKLIADKLKSSNSEVIKYELNKQISEILDHSRARSHNVFVFIKAFQLVKFDFNTNLNFARSKSVERFLSSTYKEIEYPLDPIITHYSHFRDRIKDKFNRAKKELTIKFDFLTEKNLKELFSRVGRVLHISSDDFNSKGSLFVEGDDGESYEISQEHLQHIISKAKCLYDLVILAIPQSENLAKIFVEAGIRHIVCFRFNQTFLKKSESLPSISFYNIVNEFTVTLLNSIILEQTVEESYKNAVREFNKQIANVSQHLNSFYLNKEVVNLESEGTINKRNLTNQNENKQGPGYSHTPIIAEVLLLPAESNHKIKLYGKSIDLENEETILIDGKLHDASKIRARLYNINKRNHALIGRKKEIYNIGKMIKMINMFNIYGDSGSGKTLLAKEVCYYLYTRNYFMEGIFYFDLIEIRNVEKIKALFHEASVSTAIEEAKKLKGDANSQNEERKILIVFDNVDKMLKYNENQFFLFLKSFNKERIYIHYTLVSNKEILNDSIIETIEVTPLPMQESSYLFLYYLNRPVEKKEIDIDSNEIEAAGDYKILIEKIMDQSELVSLSSRFRACRGMPKYIKKLAELATTKHLNTINWKELNLSRKMRLSNNSEENNSFNSFGKKELKQKQNVSSLVDKFKKSAIPHEHPLERYTSSKIENYHGPEFILNLPIQSLKYSPPEEVTRENAKDNEMADCREKDINDKKNNLIKSETAPNPCNNNMAVNINTNEKLIANNNTTDNLNMQNMISNLMHDSPLSQRGSEEDINNRSHIENSVQMMNNSFIRSSFNSNFTNSTMQNQNQYQNFPHVSFNIGKYNSDIFHTAKEREREKDRDRDRDRENNNKNFQAQQNLNNLNSIISQNKNRFNYGRASFTAGFNSSMNQNMCMSNPNNYLCFAPNVNSSINNNTIINVNNNTFSCSLNSSLNIEETSSKLNYNQNVTKNITNLNDFRNSINSNTSQSLITGNRNTMKKKQSEIVEVEVEEELEHKFSKCKIGDEYISGRVKRISPVFNEAKSISNSDDSHNKNFAEDPDDDDEMTPDDEDPYINNQTISPELRYSKLKESFQAANVTELNLDDTARGINTNRKQSMTRNNNKIGAANEFTKLRSVGNILNNNNQVANHPNSTKSSVNLISNIFESLSQSPSPVPTNQTFSKTFFKKNSSNKAKKNSKYSETQENITSKHDIIDNTTNTNTTTRREPFENKQDSQTISKEKKNPKLQSSLVIRNVYIPEYSFEEKYNMDTKMNPGEDRLNSVTMKFNTKHVENPFSSTQNFNNQNGRKIFKKSADMNSDSEDKSSSYSGDFHTEEENQETQRTFSNSKNKNSFDRTLSFNIQSQVSSANQTDKNPHRKKRKKGVKSGKMHKKFKPNVNNKYHQNFKKNRKKEKESDEE